MVSNMSIARELKEESQGARRRERIEGLINPIPQEHNSFAELIARETGDEGWRTFEVEILISNGFSIFVGNEFMQKVKYAASLGGWLTRASEVGNNDRWGDAIVYAGDIPDSILDKMDKIKVLERHSHRLEYRGSNTQNHYFWDIEFLVTSTQSLPVTVQSLPIIKVQKVDPFLLAILNPHDRALIEVDTKGKIIEIQREIAPKELLLVGMWDMDREILIK